MGDVSMCMPQQKIVSYDLQAAAIKLECGHDVYGEELSRTELFGLKIGDHIGCRRCPPIPTDDSAASGPCIHGRRDPKMCPYCPGTNK